jgi:hypothetical protein
MDNQAPNTSSDREGQTSTNVHRMGKRTHHEDVAILPVRDPPTEWLKTMDRTLPDISVHLQFPDSTGLYRLSLKKKKKKKKKQISYLYLNKSLITIT